MHARTPPELAIIIVTYRRESALRRLLASVAAQGLMRERYEVCVVDNGGELTPKTFNEHGVDHWECPTRNLGASAGRNCGVNATSAPLLLFLDDDGVVAGDTLKAALEAFDASPELLAARGRVLPLGHPGYSMIARHYDRGLEQCDDWLVIEGVTAIRRDAYEAVGGYRAGLFGHEGLELSLRLTERFPDGELRYLPSMVLHHDYAGSFSELWGKAKRMADAAGRAPDGGVKRAEAMYRARGFNHPIGLRRRLLAAFPRTLFYGLVHGKRLLNAISPLRRRG